jgi:hypothetical protein
MTSPIFENFYTIHILCRSLQNFNHFQKILQKSFNRFRNLIGNSLGLHVSLNPKFFHISVDRLAKDKK